MPTIRLSSIAGIADRPASDDARKQPPDPRDRDGRMFVDVLEGGYVTDDGKVAALPSTRAAATGSGWAAGASCAAGLVVHDKAAGVLLLNPQSVSPTTLVSGLDTSADAVMQEHQGLLYWWCGDARGRITSAGANLPWALPQAATPAVSVIAGTMPAGAYLVTLTWVDSVGAESSAAASAAVTLAAPGGLRITPVSPPSTATQVRVYVSIPNGQKPTWVGDYPVLSFPLDVTTAPSATSLYAEIWPETLGLSPMPTGTGMTTRGGFLVVYEGANVWFSYGTWAHLCDTRRNLIQFPEAVTGCVGVDGGLWVTTARSAYWVNGADLNTASVQEVTSRRRYAAGGKRISPEYSLVPSPRPVAMFVSDEGPVIGTADGQLTAPLANTQKWDVVGNRAEIEMVEIDGTKTLWVGVI
jgi:hypothetical protein